MSLTADELSTMVERIIEAQPAGRRRVDAAGRTFHVVMRNDFLTPRGKPYKYSEVTATVHRTVVADLGVPIVPVRYTWQQVTSRTGSAPATEWTFARGQHFQSYLLHTELTGAAPEPVREWLAQPPDIADLTRMAMDISYPDLPKSPAVDLLLMLTWDVVLFDAMCTHLVGAPELRTPGRQVNLGGVSGSWADLRFASPETGARFHNADMTARGLGFGVHGGRATVAYTFQCLDCVLTVRSGALAQAGRSSYWGTVQVDLATGDLVAAEMTEMIVATLTGPDGPSVPVQKRRKVTIEMAADEPDPGVPASTALDPAEAAIAAGAAEDARAVGEYVRWQLDVLADLPDAVRPVATMGFQSVVGLELPDAIEWIDSLQANLRSWGAGDSTGEQRFRVASAVHRQTLEGLLAFGQLAVDQSARMNIHDASGHAALEERMLGVRRDISGLLGAVEKLGA